MDNSQEHLRNIELTPIARRVEVLSFALRNAESSATNFIEPIKSQVEINPEVNIEPIQHESVSIVEDARKMVDKALEYPITSLYGDADAA